MPEPQKHATTTASQNATIKQSEATIRETAPAGTIRHSVCRWCYGEIPFEEFCATAAEIGLESIDLLETTDFPTLEKHGLTCAMVTFPTATTKRGIKVGTIEKAFNRTEHHDALTDVYTRKLEDCAAVGAERLICFSGNREGMDDEQGLENCALGLRRILPVAEKLGITLTMELLNSHVDHPDYMCDRTQWGTVLVDRLASPNFKLLYDIYHMQVMEGDVITTIRSKHEYFSHYHTGGVPGRNEIDATQELYFPAIMRAIAATGHRGFVAQEFVPKRPDKIESLRQAVEICTL